MTILQIFCIYYAAMGILFLGTATILAEAGEIHDTTKERILTAVVLVVLWPAFLLYGLGCKLGRKMLEGKKKYEGEGKRGQHEEVDHDWQGKPL